MVKISIISGENGAVYFNEEITDTATSGTLVFSSGANMTITSCGDAIDFEAKLYTTGMLVAVTGCDEDANNRTFTIIGVSAGELTVSEAVTTVDPELSTGVTFLEADPGVPVLGFYNWSLSYSGDVLETTNFDNSSGGRNYIPGMTGWTATADKYFQTANNEVDDWVGETCEIRLFINYVSAPSSGSPSQYWKGDTVVTGLDETTPVDALITQSISLQGDGTLTLKTQDDPWSCGISA